MNLDKKFSTFLEIAKVLNNHGIVPTLYGSVGIFRLVGQLDEIDDIDIVIPNSILIDKFDELVSILSKIGYKQDVTFPHEFTKGDGQIGFEPESDLTDVGINLEKLKIIKVDSVEFKELSSEDYLVVYRRNLGTQKRKVRSTELKIEALEKLVN